MADVFSQAVDFVFEALKARQQAGSPLKTESSALQALVQTVAPQVPPVVAKSRAADVPAETLVVRPVALPSQFDAAQATPPLLSFPVLPVEVDDGGLADRLDALKAKVLGCAQCANLAARRKQVFFGEGNVGAQLMFVAEVPGEDEAHCFAGEEGLLFDKILKAMALTRADVYLASTLNCRPETLPGRDKPRAPSTEELGRCLPYLAAQIALVKPKVIVALGAGVMRALFGATQTAAALRSRWHELQGVPVMPTFPLSYLISNTGIAEKRKVWEDLLQVLERLNYPISAAQRGFFTKAAQ